MLVQEIYSEGMVVVEHGGSRTPVQVTRRILLLPSALLLKEVMTKLEGIEDEKGYRKLVDHANGKCFYL